MRRTRKHNRNFRNTRKGGMNENNKSLLLNKNKQNAKPTIIHPNNLPRMSPPKKRETKARLNLIMPLTSGAPNMDRSFFTNVNSGFKAGGITSSKPGLYPPLPETPTNRPALLTNNESLMAPKEGSEERHRRMDDLVKRYRAVRQKSLINKLFGKKTPNPKMDNFGYPKSFFTVNNKVGFKP